MRAKEMTDEQLNIAIEVLMGSKEDRYRQGNIIRGSISTSPRDFCKDHPRAQHIQEVAMDRDQTRFMAHLIYTTGHSYHEGLTYDTVQSMLNATPRQRTEAAYLTLKESTQS